MCGVAGGRRPGGLSCFVCLCGPSCRTGRTRLLEEAALPEAQLVGGAGDCAAPKLVAAAQRLNLRPTVRGSSQSAACSLSID